MEAISSKARFLALDGSSRNVHGSLYSQFGSKERLVEEALGYALTASGKTTLRQPHSIVNLCLSFIGAPG